MGGFYDEGMAGSLHAGYGGILDLYYKVRLCRAEWYNRKLPLYTSASNHGPVRVRNTFHFEYEDKLHIIHWSYITHGCREMS